MAYHLSNSFKNRSRLDSFIVEKGFVKSRQRAKALIMAGKVLVDDYPLDKPGTLIKNDAKVIVKKVWLLQYLLQPPPKPV